MDAAKLLRHPYCEPMGDGCQDEMHNIASADVVLAHSNQLPFWKSGL